MSQGEFSYRTAAEETWRIFRIMAEFVEAIEVMSTIGPAVSVFGSARTRPDDPYYRQAVELAIKAGREERMSCVHDGAQMQKEVIEGVIIDRCPDCGGVWFDGGELEVLSNVLRLAADQSMPSNVASRLFQSLIQRIAE